MTQNCACQCQEYQRVVHLYARTSLIGRLRELLCEWHAVHLSEGSHFDSLRQPKQCQKEIPQPMIDLKKWWLAPMEITVKYTFYISFQAYMTMTMASNWPDTWFVPVFCPWSCSPSRHGGSQCTSTDVYIFVGGELKHEFGDDFFHHPTMSIWMTDTTRAEHWKYLWKHVDCTTVYEMIQDLPLKS